jgi:hypothetical protein
MIAYFVPVLLGTSVDTRPTARHEYAVSLIIGACGNHCLAPVPLNHSLLCSFKWAESTGALCKYRPNSIPLFGSGKKSADPDDLLKAFLFANLQDDFFGVTKLAGRESITPIYKKRNVIVPRGQRRGRNLIDRTPRKSKRRRLVECPEPKNSARCQLPALPKAPHYAFSRTSRLSGDIQEFAFDRPLICMINTWSRAPLTGRTCS